MVDMTICYVDGQVINVIRIALACTKPSVAVGVCCVPVPPHTKPTPPATEGLVLAKMA